MLCRRLSLGSLLEVSGGIAFAAEKEEQKQKQEKRQTLELTAGLLGFTGAVDDGSVDGLVQYRYARLKPRCNGRHDARCRPSAGRREGVYVMESSSSSLARPYVGQGNIHPSVCPVPSSKRGEGVG